MNIKTFNEIFQAGREAERRGPPVTVDDYKCMLRKMLQDHKLGPIYFRPPNRNAKGQFERMK